MLKAMLDTQQHLFAEGAISAYAVAETCAELGDSASALSYLRMSLSRHEGDDVNLAIEPAFTRLHANPVFKTLLAEKTNAG
jgi:hypothetical protein